MGGHITLIGLLKSWMVNSYQEVEVGLLDREIKKEIIKEIPMRQGKRQTYRMKEK